MSATDKESISLSIEEIIARKEEQVCSWIKEGLPSELRLNSDSDNNNERKISYNDDDIEISCKALDGNGFVATLQCAEIRRRDQLISSLVLKRGPEFPVASESGEGQGKEKDEESQFMDIIYSFLRSCSLHKREVYFYYFIKEIDTKELLTSILPRCYRGCIAQTMDWKLNNSITTAGALPDNDFILLQNLKEKEAYTVPISTPLSKEEVILGVKALARIHSLTWDHMFEDITMESAMRPLTDIPAAMIGLQKLYDISVHDFLEFVEEECLKLIDQERWKIIKETLPDLNIEQLLSDFSRGSEQLDKLGKIRNGFSFLPLTNGDMWTGNLMLSDKYDEKRAWLIDFQFSARGNPVDDLACLLGTSADAQLRQPENITEILNAYCKEAQIVWNESPSKCELDCPFSLDVVQSCLDSSLVAALQLTVSSHCSWTGLLPEESKRNLKERWAQLAIDGTRAISKYINSN